MTTTTSLRVIGTSDDVTTCECCGRSDLKGTVVLSDGEGEVYFGTTCAARAMGITGKQVEKDIRSAAKAKAEADRLAHVRKLNEERAAYDVWKVATYGDTTDSLDRHRRYRSEGR